MNQNINLLLFLSYFKFSLQFKDFIIQISKYEENNYFKQKYFVFKVNLNLIEIL